MHASCLLHYGACPTLGCNEADPFPKENSSAKTCRHRFDPMTYKCLYCNVDMFEHAAREFGSTFAGLPHLKKGNQESEKESPWLSFERVLTVIVSFLLCMSVFGLLLLPRWWFVTLGLLSAALLMALRHGRSNDS